MGGLINGAMLALVAAMAVAVPPPPKFPPCDEGDLSEVELISLTGAVRDALAAALAVGERGRDAELIAGFAADIAGDAALDLVVVVRVPTDADGGVGGVVRAMLRTQGARLVVEGLSDQEVDEEATFAYAGRRTVFGERSPTAFTVVRHAGPTGSTRTELWGFSAPKGKAALTHRVALSEGRESTVCGRSFGCWASWEKSQVLLLRGRGTCDSPASGLHSALPKGTVTRAAVVVVAAFTDAEEARKRFRQLGLAPDARSLAQHYVSTNGDFSFSFENDLPACEDLAALFPDGIFPGLKGPHLLARGPYLDGKKAVEAAKKLREGSPATKIVEIELVKP